MCTTQKPSGLRRFRPPGMCAGSNTTTGRWTQPLDPFNGAGEWSPDPGPYLPGETIACSRCGAEVEVSHIVTNNRSMGTQYVGRIAEHVEPA